MSEHSVVGVRYCGGCNPRYDRVKAVKQLAEQCPDITFVPGSGEQDLVLLVCGCSAQCACREGLEGEVLTLWNLEQFGQAALRLQSFERSLHPWTGKPYINSAR